MICEIIGGYMLAKTLVVFYVWSPDIFVLFFLSKPIFRDKLLLDGKVFACSDIERGPTSNQPVKLDERSNNDVIVFGGSTSAHHGLSNFYEGRFVYEHIAYNTAEQAYQHKKARLAGDQNMQKQIMFHPNASQRYLTMTMTMTMKIFYLT